MSKSEFDLWCENNFTILEPILKKKYPKCANTIQQDLSEYYVHVIERVLPDLHCAKSYLYQYIYNTHYRFHNSRKNEREGYLINNSHCSIKLTDKPQYHLSSDNSENNFDEFNTYKEPMTHKVLNIIDYDLSLDEKVLYKLYYNESLSTRKIAKMYNLTHMGVAKQLTRIRKKVKKLLEEDE